MASQHILQAPTGTRDLYPIEAARRRFITEAWRRVAINHGFEEIDGPTFEHLDLYTVKSGEGIVSELFSFRREGGEKDYALRPEFTPTLARMYAAKAASLPKPTKWFSVGPYFRAERPQRGRLREFLQWNVDYIGDPSPCADAELIRCCVDLFQTLGLTPNDVKVRLNSRRFTEYVLMAFGVRRDQFNAWFNLLDRIPKVDVPTYIAAARQLGSDTPTARRIRKAVTTVSDEPNANIMRLAHEWVEARHSLMLNRLASLEAASQEAQRSGDLMQLQRLTTQAERFSTQAVEFSQRLPHLTEHLVAGAQALKQLREQLDANELLRWIQLDPSVVRGLAYYTGTVFEVIVDNERAVAGGGRYDNLIELFGGPPTPAVGFGMGDVVLSLVLQDKGLMPSDAELMGLVGQSPDVFVISSGSPEAESQVPKLLAALRRGTPRTPSTQDSGPRTQDSSSPGLHARRSYKTTKNVGKLLQEAAKTGARFAVIIESASSAKLKDMTTGAQEDRAYTLEDLPAELRRRLNRG